MGFSCQLCSLCQTSKQACNGRCILVSESKKRGIMIVSDFPHDGDDVLGSFFSATKHSSTLVKLLKDSNIDLKEVYVTGLAKCTPRIGTLNKEGILKKEYTDKCQIYLQEELAEVEPKILLVFGEKVFSYFFPKQTFTDNRGKLLHSDTYNVDVIATYNPVSMAYTNKFDQIIKTDFRLLHDTYYKTNTTATKPTKDYRFPLKDLSILRAAAKRVKEIETFSFDIETHGSGLFNYKLLSIGFSWKEHTGISVPVWVKDQEKEAQLLKAAEYKIPVRKEQIQSGVLKNGLPRYKTVTKKGFLEEDRNALKSLLPAEYVALADLPTFAEIKRKIKATLDKEPPMRKYWGDQHDECMSLIKEIMECDTPKGAHNGSYDVNRLRGIGINVKNYAWDTILMHHLLDEERPHGLDDLSFVYTKDGGYKSGKNIYLTSTQTSWANIPTEVLLPYNAQDADVTLQLYHVFKPRLQNEGRLWNLFETHVMPAQHMLLDMSFRGSNIDIAWLNKTHAEYQQKMKDLVLDFQDLLRVKLPNAYVVANKEEETSFFAEMEKAGQDVSAFKIINLNSPANMVYVFRDVFGCTLEKKTATGDALDTNVLKKIAKKNKAAQVLMDYKALAKLDSTYLMGIKSGIDADGKLHGEFLVYGTTSGRLSSRNPNCFDDQTEVLTDSGFKFFKDLTKQDKVAQWENGEITFDYPVSYIKTPFVGNLMHVHNQYTDICGTPDHRCLLITPRGKEITVPLQKYKQHNKQLHGGIYNGGTLHFNKDFITLLVATQADGSYTKYGIDFCFTKKRKYLRLKKALKSLNCVFSDAYSKITNRFRLWTLTKDEVSKKIKEWLPEKKFTYKLLQMDTVTRDLFIKELDYWDGCVTRPLTYSSQYKQNTDVIQALLTLNNRRSIHRERLLKPGGYRKHATTHYALDSFCKNNYSYTTNIKKENYAYNGFVYCVTMPKDTVIIRRNLKVSITKNCQNLPGDMKYMFIPPSKDYLCVNVDQSAAELHIMAWISKDKNMIDIFEHKRDLHRETAAGVFKKKLEEVSDEERKIAKRISFSTAYGVSGSGLVGILEPEGVKISASQGDTYIEQWKKTYPGCARFLRDSIRTFKTKGFLETPFGRRRHKYKVYTDKFKESSSERQAQNFTIQSTASDIQIYEMVHMYPTLLENGVLPVFTVHDSIVMWCPKDKLKWLRDFYNEQTCRRFSNEEFPGLNNCWMCTEMEVGRNYGEHIKLPYDCDFEHWKSDHPELFDK